MPSCPICFKHFTPPKGWDKAVCPGCFRPKGEQTKTKPKQSVKIDLQRPKVNDRRPWVVVYLTDDGPRELTRFNGKDAAKEYAARVFRGEVEEWEYLKGSAKIRVRQAVLTTSGGKVILPKMMLGEEMNHAEGSGSGG